MKFVVVIKETVHGPLLVVSDEEILGKKFVEDGKILDLTNNFYSGEIMTKEEVVGLFDKSRHIHLTGKNSVSLGKNKGLIEEGRVLVVDGVPHAEIFIEG